MSSSLSEPRDAFFSVIEHFKRNGYKVTARHEVAQSMLIADYYAQGTKELVYHSSFCKLPAEGDFAYYASIISLGMRQSFDRALRQLEDYNVVLIKQRRLACNTQPAYLSVDYIVGLKYFSQEVRGWAPEKFFERRSEIGRLKLVSNNELKVG